MTRPEYVYVASSWRNTFYPAVIATLTAADVPHYDFRNPPNGAGFGWEQTRSDAWELCDGNYDLESVCTKGHDEHRARGRRSNRWGKIAPHKDLAPGQRHTETIDSYLAMLAHPRAQQGFKADISALRRADAVVMVLPCGKSAHLELGIAIGEGKRTAILLEEPMEPDLMYLAADYLAPDLMGLLAWLGVED